MEILSAGSFINLENQEKIEHLKFTAAELAKAALGTAGFVNTEEAGKNLGLEFWQGLEYMCRETEAATVKNIFLTHFLNHLREEHPGQNANELLPEPEISVSESIEKETAPEDEFLGLMEMTTTEENLEENPVEEPEDEIDEAEENFIPVEEISDSEIYLATTAKVKTTIQTPNEMLEEPASSAEEQTESSESGPENEAQAQNAASSLSLAEKEPYQWGKCTVTATIQLLPTVDGVIGRKAVLSIRTHDFVPQISLVELPGDDLTAELGPELEKILEKYKNDLPVKVMDKLKKEKLTGKKSTPKTTSEPKTISPATPQSTMSGTAQTTPPASNQATPIVPQAAPTGQQGTLFG